MSQKSDLHSISLQYQVRTNKQGHRDIERLLPILGSLQNSFIRNMTRSAKGTLANPGKNVAQKRGLERSILIGKTAARINPCTTVRHGAEWVVARDSFGIAFTHGERQRFRFRN